MKIAGFKHTGRGPKSGHSFGAGSGFHGSTGKVQHVKSYQRGVPASPQFKAKAPAPQKGGNTLVQRSQPVTQADKSGASGKTPLRAGFAEGGKVNTVGQAFKTVKQLINSGVDPDLAAQRAARAARPAPKRPTASADELAVANQKAATFARGGVACASPKASGYGGAFRGRPLVR